MRGARAAVALFVAGLSTAIVAEPPKKTVPADAAKVIARINLFRAAAGLAAVEYDADLSAGCEAHSKYLVLNDDRVWNEPGFDFHDEVEKLPGFSVEGQNAGRSGVVYWKEPLPAVDWHWATLFHRVPFLSPQLKRVGVGGAPGTKWGAVSVIDVVSAVDSAVEWSADRVILFPADGQKGVPVALGRKEMPNPIPEDLDGDGGYPITVTFAPGVEVKDARASLKSAKNRSDVPFWFSSPDKPSDDRYQRNTICLIAKDPLSSGSAYQVTVEATVSGQAWKKSWAFSTAAEKK